MPSFSGEKAFTHLVNQCDFGPRNPGSDGHKNALKYYQSSMQFNNIQEKVCIYHTAIGRCYRHLQKYKKSVENLLAMITLNPHHPKIHYELALSYNEMKNSDTAFEHLQIATDIWKDADREYNIAQSAKKKLEKWSA